MKNPFTTVVVPVYNRENLVGKTIDSILSQKYENFELLLVDDGSKDLSLEVCRKYEKIDSRIKVFTKENGGVSTARNLGIENAQGEYICFIDSDDIVESDYLSSFVDEINKEDYDLVICGFRNVLSTGETKFCELPGGNISDADVFWKNFGNLLEVNLLRSPVNKLYRLKTLIEHSIRFDKSTQIAEDALFNSLYYEYVESVSVINKPLYVVRLHDSDAGLSNSFHDSFFKCQKILFSRYLALLKKHDCFSRSNRLILSSQFFDLMIFGLKTAFNAKGQLLFSELSECCMNEVLNVEKRENYLSWKLWNLVASKNTKYLFKMIVCPYVLKAERIKSRLYKGTENKIITLIKLFICRILGVADIIKFKKNINSIVVV